MSGSNMSAGVVYSSLFVRTIRRSAALQFANMTFQLTDEGHVRSTSDVTMFVPLKRVVIMGDLLNIEIHPGAAMAHPPALIALIASRHHMPVSA